MNNPAPDFRLEPDAWGRLRWTSADGRSLEGVSVVRAFPVSEPGQWISICDAEGHEILSLEDLAGLSPEMRRTLEAELARREFIPVIQRIISATTEEPSHWRVETDRGPTAFEVDSEDDVHRIEPHQASVVDAHGIRYLIPDVRRLDAASRRILDHFL